MTKAPQHPHHTPHQNHNGRRHLHWSTRLKGGHRLFTLKPIISHLIIIALCAAAYYAVTVYYFFFDWSIYVYYATKIIIAYEVLTSAVRSLVIPLLALIIGSCGVAGFYSSLLILNNVLDPVTALQLVTVGGLGVIITFLIKR